MEEEDIDIHGAEYRELLTHYALAMISAQRLEGSLKVYLFLNNAIEKRVSGYTIDELFDIKEISDWDRTSMSRILDNIKSFFRLRNVKILTEEGSKDLEYLIKLRNHLAHNYVNENFKLFKNAEARKMLIVELKYYEESFETVVSELQSLIVRCTEEGKLRGLWRNDERDDERDESKLEKIYFENLRSRLKEMELEE